MAKEWTLYNPTTPRSTTGFFYPPPSPTHVDFPIDDAHTHYTKVHLIPPVPPLHPSQYDAPISNSRDKTTTIPPVPLSPPHSTPVVSTDTSRKPLRKTLLVFLGLIPLIPVLSCLYTIVGAGILSLPISLAASGAIGAVILSLPLTLGVYFLIIPWTSSPPPEDFFDDDSLSSFSLTARFLKVKYMVCCLSGILVGAVSAPLGAVCVSQRAGDAAAAGALGGIVVFFGAGAIGLVALVVLVVFRRRISRKNNVAGT